MKQIYLGVFSIAFTSLVSAQVNNAPVSLKQSRSDNFGVPATQTNNVARAEGDVLWSNTFSTPSDWTIGNNPGHTAGDWAILNAVPATLVSQAGSYGFPTSMNSTSGGNFAFIDSDAQGGSATQNAYIQTASSIALANLLTANGDATSAAIYLKFTEIFRHFYDENYVEISNDGGATWTQFQVNAVPEVPVNTNSGNPEFEVVNITSASGGTWTNDVKIRFLYKGAWDWFWGVDDVELVVAYDNDIKISTVYQATDLITTQGLDYFRVPVSQTSFPGVTFGAKVINNGGASQANVRLTASGPSYNESGTATAIAAGATDSLFIATPYVFPATAGTTVVNISTDLGVGVTDGDLSNNQKSMSFVRDPNVFGRDNNVRTGAISQVTSQNDLELSIGNVMEIFDPITITGIQIRLVNQAAAVGQQINGIIELFDGQDFALFAETDFHTIQTGDLDNFVTIPLLSPVDLAAGDVILVMAHHLGGANEVAFGYAQPTIQSTVLGRVADGSSFQLTSPNAIMIRLTSEEIVDPSSINENALNNNVSIFPNPSVGETTIEVNGAIATGITVVDVTGKVVYSTNVAEGTSIVTLNTTAFANGVYTVNIATDKGSVTKKLVVKN